MDRVVIAAVLWGETVVATRGLRRGEVARVGSALVSLPPEVVSDGTVFAHVDGDGCAIGAVPPGASGRKVRADGSTQALVGPRRVVVEAGETLHIALGHAPSVEASEPGGVSTSGSPLGSARSRVSIHDYTGAAIELRLEVAAVGADAVAGIRAAGRGVASGARPHVLAAAVAHAFALAVASQSAFATDPEVVEMDRVYEIQRSLARIDERLEEERADGMAREDDDRPTERRGARRAVAAPRSGSTGGRKAEGATRAAALRPADVDPTAIGVPSEPEPPAGPRAEPGSARMVERELKVSGHDRPETIERVVRQSASRLRACYQAALARDPGLSGSLAIDAVISAGAVAEVRDAGLTLADAEVVRCGARAIAHCRSRCCRRTARSRSTTSSSSNSVP